MTSRLDCSPVAGARWLRRCVALSAMVSSLLAMSPSSRADEDTAKAKAIIAVVAVAAMGYTDVRMEDLARIDPGTFVPYPVFLYRNMKVALFATQDQNIDSLDIFITDADDNILASSHADQIGAIVEFTPRWTGQYKAYVRNTRGRTGWYVMALVY